MFFFLHTIVAIKLNSLLLIFSSALICANLEHLPIIKILPVSIVLQIVKHVQMRPFANSATQELI